MKILAVGSGKTITEELINRGGMKMTICDNCIHDDVCGIEGHLDEALIFCAHRSVRCGHWVEHIDHRYDYDREQGDISAGVSYTCSVCGFHGYISWHFCPNCGFIENSE